jgi:hypothetical protein
MSAGVDFAFSPHPSTSALKGAGVVFVCRYISTSPGNDTNGKNLIPSECKALLGAGLKICVVVEEGASYMLGGHDAGVKAAHHADAVVKALGMPGIPVYIAADFDARPDQQAPINACLDGMASVIGRDRTGVYGGFYVVKRAFDAGKCRYGWQTVAWSGGQWDRRAQLRQGLSFSLGGASVDHDQANYDDYGQWPRPAAPAPPSSGLHQHATDGKMSLGDIAASRHTPVGAWIDLQQKLHPQDADALVKDCVPAAGLKWWSINP